MATRASTRCGRSATRTNRIKKQAADRARHFSPPSWLYRYAEEVTMLDFEQCWAALERRDARAHDWGVLPGGLHIAAAAAQEHHVLRNDGSGRGGGAAALQALPANRRDTC